MSGPFRGKTTATWSARWRPDKRRRPPTCSHGHGAGCLVLDAGCRTSRGSRPPGAQTLCHGGDRGVQNRPLPASRANLPATWVCARDPSMCRATIWACLPRILGRRNYLPYVLNERFHCQSVKRWDAPSPFTSPAGRAATGSARRAAWEPLPPSISHGVRSPLVLQRLRPFQPACGSSMRPSNPLA
jgi:hypothetical protein